MWLKAENRLTRLTARPCYPRVSVSLRERHRWVQRFCAFIMLSGDSLLNANSEI